MARGYECATWNNATEYTDEFTQGNHTNHAKMQHFKVSYSSVPYCARHECASVPDTVLV